MAQLDYACVLKWVYCAGPLSRECEAFVERTASFVYVCRYRVFQGKLLLLLLLLLLPILLLLLTALGLSLGGSSPYTSTDKTNKNKYT
jgi:hypothetical protein